MTQEQRRLYTIIDELLWNEWDPIGVNEYEEARDEYYSYIPQVLKLKIDNADIETMAQFLFKVETERMGLLGNIENCRRVANIIISASL
ncbi:hypothetical protein A8C56_21145 [Niabella ginsenosidivorans]|uniref:DUF1871 domain-containing protein n=1 Tax=Niabella ginsenosidivorans TaxID=1176587 RepID=A0A1A9I8Z5_9BACT|nr:hypothetical protein [Niabella ginsenosidivorans]ANH83151.1 hypothetical protein A8C56_21145 [Niabella ginsenosidivorans]